MKYILLLGLLPCLLSGMRKSPSMYNFQAEAAHIQIVDLPQDNRPDCSYCKQPALYYVLSFHEFRFAYCLAHFRAAGFTQPREVNKENN